MNDNIDFEQSEQPERYQVETKRGLNEYLKEVGRRRLEEDMRIANLVSKTGRKEDLHYIRKEISKAYDLSPPLDPSSREKNRFNLFQEQQKALWELENKKLAAQNKPLLPPLVSKELSIKYKGLSQSEKDALDSALLEKRSTVPAKKVPKQTNARDDGKVKRAFAVIKDLCLREDIDFFGLARVPGSRSALEPLAIGELMEKVDKSVMIAKTQKFFKGNGHLVTDASPRKRKKRNEDERVELPPAVIDSNKKGSDILAEILKIYCFDLDVESDYVSWSKCATKEAIETKSPDSVTKEIVITGWEYGKLGSRQFQNSLHYTKVKRAIETRYILGELCSFERALEHEEALHLEDPAYKKRKPFKFQFRSDYEAEQQQNNQ